MEDKAKMSEQELVDMLDKLFDEGGGHVNVRTSGDGGFNVDTFRASDGACKNGACLQPTEHLDKYDNE